MTDTQITTAVEEVARLLRENPSWSYEKAINKAKELIGNENLSKMEKIN